MKKYVVSFLAVVVAIAASSFTTGAISAKPGKQESAATSYAWYNFNGGLLDMCDPAFFSLDENNWPDCPPYVGLIYCEIYAQPSQWEPGEPNLFTIIDVRMKPLL